MKVDKPTYLRTPGLNDAATTFLESGVLAPGPLWIVDTAAARFGEEDPEVLLALALVLHAQHDDLVEVEHGEQLYAWGNKPKTLKIFPLGDHNSILFANIEEYFALIARFVAEV